MFLLQDLVEILSKQPSTQGDLMDSVRNRVALVNWDGMGHSIAGINDSTSCATSRVKTEDGLITEIELRNFKFIKPITFKH